MASWRRYLPWALLVAVVAGGAYVMHRLNTGRLAEAELRRVTDLAADEAKARFADQIVVEQQARERVVAELERLEGQNDELHKALEAARHALPGARPVVVVSASTGSVALPKRYGAEPECKTVCLPHGDGVICSNPCAAGREACWLAPGDSAEVTLEGAVLESRGKALVLVVVPEVYRTQPGPRVKVFSGKLETDLTDAIRTPGARAAAARWGIGGGVLGSFHGLSPALVATTPPLTVPWVGWELEAAGLAAFGADGLQAGAFLLGRL